MSAVTLPPVGGGTVRRWMRERRRWAGVTLGALLAGALAGELGTSGSATRILVLGIVLLPVLLWRRPYLSPAVLLASAVLVEQTVPGPRIPLTDRIPMFQGVGPGHLQGADMLLLMVLVIYLVRSPAWGPRWFPRTHVSLAIRGVLACVLLAVAVGQAHGGDLRTALMEARPYVYLAATYFFASVFIRDRRAIRAVLWAFVASVGFKAVQGIYVWVLNRHLEPKPESFISHEASYFFVIDMVLVLALWLFDERSRLRTWATRLLPLVIFANTVNDRRAAWEMLGGALLCFGVAAYRALPIRRRLLGKAVVGLVLVSAVYFPVMWNSNSSLAAPARAIRSQVAPSTRDADSDTYRVQENANLELNIRQDGLLGKGFGVKIDYALPITDISQTDPLIAYIPHNDVLDVLMRMGLLGGIAMWGLIATAIISGIRLAMSRDHELAVVGMVVACSIVAYALMGAVDQGFFFFRIAFITGTLLGLAEAARRLARAEATGPSAPAAEGTSSWPAMLVHTDPTPWPARVPLAEEILPVPGSLTAEPAPATGALTPAEPAPATGALTPAEPAPARARLLVGEPAPLPARLPVALDSLARASCRPIDARPRPRAGRPASGGASWHRNRAWIWDESRSGWREGVVCATVSLGSRRWVGYALSPGPEGRPAAVPALAVPTAWGGRAGSTPRLTWVSTPEVGVPPRR